MSIKDVLVHLDAGTDSAPRLRAAIDLARAFDARLMAFHPVVEPTASLVELPPERLFRERREARADESLRAAAAQAAQAGVALLPHRATAPLGRLPELFARLARSADLVILGRPQGGADADEVGLPSLTELAFLATGRPALVLPPDGARVLPPATALVAWDGSREAARAVHEALPLLRRAGSVSVAVVDPERVRVQVGPEPGADLAAHLARHGVASHVEILSSSGRRTGEALLARAEEKNADLLVMGGYGHWRLREVVLGGTTRHLLAYGSVPLLLSH
jgi:nucleotide-binding universal stress UspA family protein